MSLAPITVVHVVQDLHSPSATVSPRCLETWTTILEFMQTASRPCYFGHHRHKQTLRMRAVPQSSLIPSRDVTTISSLRAQVGY